MASIATTTARELAKSIIRFDRARQATLKAEREVKEQLAVYAETRPGAVRGGQPTIDQARRALIEAGLLPPPSPVIVTPGSS